MTGNWVMPTPETSTRNCAWIGKLKPSKIRNLSSENTHNEGLKNKVVGISNVSAGKNLDRTP